MMVSTIVCRLHGALLVLFLLPIDCFKFSIPVTKKKIGASSSSNGSGYYGIYGRGQSAKTKRFVVEGELSSGGSTSLEYALDPKSAEARELLLGKLGISEEAYAKLEDLAELVVEWNGRLNLISRKDCTLEVVFGRHILPSVALIGMQGWRENGEICSIFEEQIGSERKLDVIDVGTGGGFPGLPLAIVLPQVNFLLVDSVGKKLRAVEEMVEELGLDNCVTYHGRAEEMTDLNPDYRSKFDVCVGRSVAALPKFCFWISELLKKDTGSLLYIIGGELEEMVQDSTLAEVEISSILGGDKEYSDKKAILFGQPDVTMIADASGEKKIKRGLPGNNKKKKRQKNPNDTQKVKLVKGAWAKRDNSAPKQRGAENFRRFSSD
mmetsp:Transcript_25626/g.38301  ORF Transcript_25626/g.38301 Transcript_25626/m.38301 type:complete len:379 (-) Transcript_25626:221-1357(-)|eukprot:CAMPEP_0116012010 /NCGR_PEP_ID=MMETSP0321-20121206/4884_1 /TAXON_ID=163516 /ORGANISM="Leptocylindrus danicus var. danicus, Strain B650" /LENGTH=378 /DNA_ID=CAMNT_0003481303 /DNA_START=110 /DNA_END=1246 /DNA_ORIENTATION=+